MTYLKRTLQPEIYLFVCALAVAAIVAGGLWTVTTVHAARSAEQRVCAAKVEMLKARNPVIRTYWRPADDCLALRVLAKEKR